ncbi:hypothetical protein V3C99_008264 [Haemonchus contortus]
MLDGGTFRVQILRKIRADRWDPQLECNMQPRVCYTSLKDIKHIARKRGMIEGRKQKRSVIFEGASASNNGYS